jgi:hypothetical protein
MYAQGDIKNELKESHRTLASSNDRMIVNEKLWKL